MCKTVFEVTIEEITKKFYIQIICYLIIKIISKSIKNKTKKPSNIAPTKRGANKHFENKTTPTLKERIKAMITSNTKEIQNLINYYMYK